MTSVDAVASIPLGALDRPIIAPSAENPPLWHGGREASPDAGLPFFRYHPDPIATGSIRAAAETCACCRHDENQLESFLTHLGESATAMLFRCTACGTHLACTDAS